MLVFDEQRKKVTQRSLKTVFIYNLQYLKRGFRNPRPRGGLSFCFDGQPTQRPLGSARPHGDGAAMDGVKSPELERVPRWTWLWLRETAGLQTDKQLRPGDATTATVTASQQC